MRLNLDRVCPIIFFQDNARLTIKQTIDQGVKEYTDCMCTAGKTVVPGECGSRCDTRLYISLALSVFGTMINFSGYAAHATVYQVNSQHAV